jgi:hypothetical protein
MTMAQLNKQAFDIDRRIVGLQAQAEQLSGKGHEALGAILQSQALSEEAGMRAKTLERRLDRERSKAAKAQRTSKPTPRTIPFSAFVPFPYEQEKARVLAWFAE